METNTEFMQDFILENEIATEAELQLVTDINGYNAQSMWDIISVRTGLKSLEQLEDEGYLMPSMC